MIKKSIFTLFLLVLFSTGFHQVFADIDNMGLMMQHSFSAEFSVDETDNSVRVILPNKKTNTFVLWRDFKYTPKTENHLSLTVSGDDYQVIDTEGNKTYTFSAKNNHLEMILSGTWNLLFLNYNPSWKLFYVTDNQTNTIYFSYDEVSGLVSKVQDIFGNTLEFTYEKVLDNSFLLTHFSSNGREIPLSYTEEGLVKEIPQSSLSFTKAYFQKIAYSTSSGETIFNPSDAVIHYKRQGNKLYSFYDGNIFVIDQTGKRQLLLQLKWTKIDDIFVTSKGVIYLRIWESIQKYISLESRTAEVYKAKNIDQFFVSDNEENVYTLNRFTPWYKIYSLKNKQEIELQTSERFDSFETTGNGMLTVLHSEFQTWQENPEFSLKYQQKLQEIEDKIIHLSLTEKQKERFRQSLLKYRERRVKGNYDVYQREQILYLLDKIQKMSYE